MRARPFAHQLADAARTLKTVSGREAKVVVRHGRDGPEQPVQAVKIRSDLGDKPLIVLEVQPVALPVTPDEGLKRALHLFREFVLRNATQWELGAYSPGHPMWALVAEVLGDVPDITSGPLYRFIQPGNESSLVDLLP